jgi:hypothetical protein
MGFGLVTGVHRGWIEVKWPKLFNDAGLPFLNDPPGSHSFDYGKQAR